MKTLFLLVAAFGSVSVQAGGLVGNGGDTVVCTDSNGRITSVEVLDLYEGRVFRGLTPDLGTAGLSIPNKLAMIRDRLANASQLYADEVYGNLTGFSDAALFLRNVTLVDIPDSNHIAVPKNCTIQQIAVQREPLVPGDKVFTINADLWDLLDNDNKAALMLHEVLLRKAVGTYKQENSVPTRYLVGLFTSKVFSNPKAADLYEALHYAQATRVPLDNIKDALSENGAGPIWLCFGKVYGGAGEDRKYVAHSFERHGDRISGFLCRSDGGGDAYPAFKNATIHEANFFIDFDPSGIIYSLRGWDSSFERFKISFPVDTWDTLSFDRFNDKDHSNSGKVYFIPEKNLVCVKNLDHETGRLQMYPNELGYDRGIEVPPGKSACVDESKKVVIVD